MATVEILGAVVIERDLEGQPAKVQRAFVRAAKRSIDSGRSVMVKLIAGDTGLQQKVVREAVIMRYPSLADPVASMRARTKRIPLIDFRARGPMPSRGRGNGVTYRNPGGGRSRLEHAFIATTTTQTDGSGGAHLGVFARASGARRLPIKEKYGPSIGHVFSKFRQQGVDRALEVFDKNFDHELQFAQTEGGSAGAA
jgi:hypothetical protein